MSDLVRISMSLEADLLRRFDRLIREQGYPTRSEAIKALMWQSLTENAWAGNQTVAGSITLVYDHHRTGIVQQLTDIQHNFGSVIVSTQHVHLDHDNCLEIIVVRGQANRIRQLLGRLKSAKGLKHNSLVLAAVASG